MRHKSKTCYKCGESGKRRDGEWLRCEDAPRWFCSRSCLELYIVCGPNLQREGAA